jgi:gliding motility-associated-like protein
MYRIGHIVCFLLWALSAQSQGDLCNTLPAGSGVGGFDIVGGINAGCSPLRVEVVNTSGSTDIHYNFDYKGEDLSTLSQTATNTIDVLFATTTARPYTILQYGKDANGKAIYACKNVSVRPNLQPEFSYSQCNISVVEVIIPKSKNNIFPNYKLTINGDDLNSISFDSTQLPFAINKNITLPGNIKLEGLGLSGLNCGNVKTSSLVALNASNYPNGIVLPYDPNIDKVELLEKGKALFEIKGSYNPIGYNLNIRENSPNTNFSIYKTGVLPGEFQVDIPDSNKSYCFYINRNVCSEYSSEVCTIPQSLGVTMGNNINLSWPVYPSEINKRPWFANYNTLEKEIFLEKKVNGVISTTQLQSGVNNYDEIIDKCVNNILFRVKMKISGFLQGYRYSSFTYSNWDKLKLTQLIPTPLNEVFATVQNDGKVKIELLNTLDWKIPKKRFLLFDSANFQLDSIASNESVFSIPSNFSNLNKCYKVGYVDDCEFRSELSNKVCPVYLEKGLSQDLLWNNMNPFGNDSINKYFVLELDEILKTEVNRVPLSNSVQEYKPNLNSYISNGVFKIEIISNSNVKSYSNIVEIPKIPFLFVPNIFSPNGDYLNDFFEIVDVVGNLKTFDLKVFNRWGEQIFYSQDINHSWDGKNGNKAAPIGTYFYVLDSTFTNSQKIFRKGSIELIR